MCCWWEDYCVSWGCPFRVSGANFFCQPISFFRLFRFCLLFFVDIEVITVEVLTAVTPPSLTIWFGMEDLLFSPLLWGMGTF